MKRRHRISAIIWILILVFVALALILLSIKLRQSSQPKIVPEIDNRDISRTERQIEEARPEQQGQQRRQEHKVRVAIVIDDMGYDKKIFRKFVDLGIPLTFSVLPGERFSTPIAKEARLLNY